VRLACEDNKVNCEFKLIFGLFNLEGLRMFLLSIAIPQSLSSDDTNCTYHLVHNLVTVLTVHTCNTAGIYSLRKYEILPSVWGNSSGLSVL